MLFHLCVVGLVPEHLQMAMVTLGELVVADMLLELLESALVEKQHGFGTKKDLVSIQIQPVGVWLQQTVRFCQSQQAFL